MAGQPSALPTLPTQSRVDFLVGFMLAMCCVQYRQGCPSSLSEYISRDHRHPSHRGAAARIGLFDRRSRGQMRGKTHYNGYTACLTYINTRPFALCQLPRSTTKFFVSVSYGGNTHDQEWTPVLTWRPWTDFTFRNLSSIFSQELHLTAAPFDKSPPFCDYDKEVYNETMLEKALERFVMPIVNRMLQQACQGHQPPPYYGAGSAVGSSADWALRSVAHTYEMGNYRPLLLGETKLSAKWTTDLSQTTMVHI
ncbi:Putative protein of unknown function [Podospora comata]|uniref:Uncharacterized protein n=1 Tax=Podospora comata TaxID=48703 RepID=A0ABY6S966_PODCO|nr:Putative protein of unknown function [Podospora comata]